MAPRAWLFASAFGGALATVGGCRTPAPAAPVPATSSAVVAIANSEIGFVLDPATGEARIYTPRYDAAGEEKLRPARVERLTPWPRVVQVRRTATEIRVEHEDGSRNTLTLLPGGCGVVDRLTPSPPAGAAPGSYTQEDGFSTFWSEPGAKPKAIPVPRVSITIDSDDPRDDRVVKALLADLVTAVHPRLRRSIAPMGLTNEIYFGHVFWDADVWVFPALALLDPAAAAEIPRYRLRTLPQARKNWREWMASGRPIARGKLGEIASPTSIAPGAKFAWESSESGRETVPGSSRFEDHISGSVAWSLGQAADLGLVPQAESERLRTEVAAFYATRSEKTSRGTELKGTVSPDEHFTGDNDLYTNLVAELATGRTYVRPRDDRTLLSYDGDRGRGYKQAAALLAVYPLQDPEAERNAGAMLDRFAPGVIPNGPAMTDAIHAIVAARNGRADEGLNFWRRSWDGFYDLDRGMFSERRKGTRREYFYTGAAGTLQAVLYGFVGLRVDQAGGSGTLVAKLNNGKELRCAPHLPKGWRSVKISGLTAMGRRYDLAVYSEGRTELRPAASK